jgi:hypothetical protein
MEGAPSAYWKPPFYPLEAHWLDMAGQRQGRQASARQAQDDLLAAVWLCKVAVRQMLRPSFVVPPPIRQPRDLTHCRIDLVEARTAEKSRVEKLLEAQIKLSVVASDIFGVSGRDMTAAVVVGERDPTVLAQLARRRMRAKISRLEAAFVATSPTTRSSCRQRCCGGLIRSTRTSPTSRPGRRAARPVRRRGGPTD